MRKIKLLALPVVALLLPVFVLRIWYACMEFKNLSLLREWLMPESLLKTLWLWGPEFLSSEPLPYTVAVYLLLAASWVWWFLRPKPLSAAAVFWFSFMGGGPASIFVWILRGKDAGCFWSELFSSFAPFLIG
jgi:hypothetical protein